MKWNPPDPVIDRLPDQAIRITVGRLVSTVHSEHLVLERIQRLQSVNQRPQFGKGTANVKARWTPAQVRQIRELHLIHHQSICQIAAQFNTHDATISGIVRWRDWAHCDHDLRELPRPKLVGGIRRPVLTPEEQAVQDAARLERRREYCRAWRRRNQSRHCSACIHHDPKGTGCGLEYPEARLTKGTFARRCPAFHACP
jgi:hypothetical protein